MAASRRSRGAVDTASPIGMLQVMETWAAVEEDQNKVISVRLDLDRSGKEPSLQITVESRLPVVSSISPPEHVRISRWPCSNHRTVLGLVHWLMHQIDSEIEAANALERLSVR